MLASSKKFGESSPRNEMKIETEGFDIDPLDDGRQSSMIKPHTTTSASRFKPSMTPDNLHEQIEKLRFRKMTSKTSDSLGGSQSQVNFREHFRNENKLEIQTTEQPKAIVSRHIKQLSNATKETGNSFSTKSKSSVASLPKIPRQISSQQGHSVPKRPLKKTKSEILTGTKPTTSKSPDDNASLNLLLNLQSDPLLQGVYSPTFFATSFPMTTTLVGNEFPGYRFDSYKVKIPSLLIGDKV